MDTFERAFGKANERLCITPNVQIAPFKIKLPYDMLHAYYLLFLFVFISLEQGHFLL